MDKPQIIRINPLKIEDEIQGPAFCGLVEKGWRLAAPVILEDQTRPEGDRIRLGLIMFPPVQGQAHGGRVERAVVAVAAVAAVIALVVSGVMLSIVW